ncbi:unnamed protein product [Caenorhabditis bovis]|uniref:BTB domain-containing protein n=1 Tax=Caenorhabditis bovis TaxID=2654633 RepID=A0A8S1EYA2_9PELO|nr:unnamed protein product [Caenorhabditis bovis]
MSSSNRESKSDSSFGQMLDSGNNPSSSRRPSTANNECVTTVDPVILTQRWTISNFDSLIKLSQPGSCLRSTVFRDDAIPDACWQLCLYPGGKREENANNVSLFLKMSATSPSKEVILKAEYRFYFLDDKEEPKFSNVNIGEFHAKPPKGGHSWGLRNIPTQKVQNSIRSDKSLVISCQIELIPDVSKVPCRRVPMVPTVKMPINSLPTSWVESELRMLESAEGYDMEIEAGIDECEKFYVHSFKLSAHSDVFRRMFTHSDILETSEKRLRISDFTPTAVRAMLQFMYGGVIRMDLEIEDTMEVMQIAEKYQIESLKRTCEQYLLDRLVVSNVLDCLAQGDTFQSVILTEACMEYIVHHRHKVMSMPAWKAFLQAKPSLGNEVLGKILSVTDVSPPLKKSRI